MSNRWEKKRKYPQTLSWQCFLSKQFAIWSFVTRQGNHQGAGIVLGYYEFYRQNSTQTLQKVCELLRYLTTSFLALGTCNVSELPPPPFPIKREVKVAFPCLIQCNLFNSPAKLLFGWQNQRHRSWTPLEITHKRLSFPAKDQ